jgi:protoporphyrin/coproporphyrin ferrochelatase
MRRVGLVVIAHGTVDSLDELPTFLTNIRRGHAPSAELLHEVTRRYEAIGGQSPLNAITREVAEKLSRATGLPARACGRLFSPYPKDVVKELAELGVEDFIVVPLAQHSAPLYVQAVREAVTELVPDGRTRGPENWGREPALVQLFASRVDAALANVPDDELATTTVVWSAHSLPTAVVRAGDPYDTEVHAAAAALEPMVKRKPGRFVLSYQSQGMSSGPGGRPIEWMGPDLHTVMKAQKAAGQTRVLVAPVGFLADHVEILYDLDIEALGWAEALSLGFSRTASLNADDAFVRALMNVLTPFLAPEASPGAP